MNRLIRSAIVAAFTLGLSMSAPGAGYVENWDSPALQSHHWNYYVQNDLDTPMAWSASGGATGGHVQAPLNSLMLWGNGYWPAYTIASSRDPGQELQLTPDTWVTARLNALGSADLKGGLLQFFIGYWSATNNYAFFCHKQPLTVNPNGWIPGNAFQLGGDDNWTAVFQAGPTTTATAIYSHPQQYGFAIINATTHPTGSLGFDDFSAVVPEPQGLLLLGLGLIGLALRRRASG